jgi:hypothetical protein
VGGLVTFDHRHYAARANRKQAWAMTLITTTSPTSDAQPIAEASSVFSAFVLGRLRCAHIRMRLALNVIDVAGVALKAGWVDGEDALAMLDEAGLLPLIEASS